MKILVTAGATQTPIDQVRAITNIFKGKTGARIAQQLNEEGHGVTLLTSNPEGLVDTETFRVSKYRTFDELAASMEFMIRRYDFDVIIHSAAVSDYRVARVLGEDLQPVNSSKKISGSHDKLFLEMVPTYKIVDKIRSEWGFKGILVKFKLQVGISDEELLAIARKSRATSDADLIIANCLEWAKEYAYVVDRAGNAEKVTRDGIGPAISRRLG